MFVHEKTTAKNIKLRKLFTLLKRPTRLKDQVWLALPNIPLTQVTGVEGVGWGPHKISQP